MSHRVFRSLPFSTQRNFRQQIANLIFFYLTGGGFGDRGDRGGFGDRDRGGRGGFGDRDRRRPY